MALSTNFKDSVLKNTSGKRQYKMTNNSNNTVSFEDVTEYSQEGSSYGAKEINEERKKINDLDAGKLPAYYYQSTYSSPYTYAFRLPASAKNYGSCGVLVCINSTMVLVAVSPSNATSSQTEVSFNTLLGNGPTSVRMVRDSDDRTRIIMIFSSTRGVNMTVVPFRSGLTIEGFYTVEQSN